MSGKGEQLSTYTSVKMHAELREPAIRLSKGQEACGCAILALGSQSLHRVRMYFVDRTSCFLQHSSEDTTAACSRRKGT